MSARRDRFRVLVVAEGANPESMGAPLAGYFHARALMRVTDAHLVTHTRNAEGLRRDGLGERDVTVIDSDRALRVAFRIREAFVGRQREDHPAPQGLQTLAYPYFEYLVWQKFGDTIRKGSYDIVHRILPASPTAPSLLARRCARTGVPFVLGPIQGDAPWPRAFDGIVPGYRATRRYSAAILLGSPDMLARIPKKYRTKCIYLPSTESVSWEAKARHVVEVYRWVLGRRNEKPDFEMSVAEGVRGKG